MRPKTHLRPIRPDAFDPHDRVGPKTLKTMRPIRASREVLEVFASTPLEVIRRDDGEVRLVKAKAGRRRKAGAQSAAPQRAVVKMVPSGEHFAAVVDVAPPADDTSER